MLAPPTRSNRGCGRVLPSSTAVNCHWPASGEAHHTRSSEGHLRAKLDWGESLSPLPQIGAPVEERDARMRKMSCR